MFSAFLGFGIPGYSQELSELTIEELQAELQNDPDVEKEIEIYQLLCERLLRSDSTAINYCSKAQELIGDNPTFEKYLLSIYTNLGIYHVREGEIALSIEYFRKRLELAQKFGRDTVVADTYRFIGNVFASAGRYDSALYQYLQAQEMYQALNYENGQLYETIANLKVTTNPQEARLFYHKAIAVSTRNNQQTGLANAYLNFSNLLVRSEEYDSAIFYLRLASNHYEKTNRVRLWGSSHRLLGKVYLDTEQFDSARYYLNSAISKLEEINYVRGLAEVYHLYGTSLQKAGQVNEAASWTRKGMDLNQQAGLMHHYRMGLLQLHEIQISKNEFESALTNYKEYQALTDSIFSEERLARIDELEQQFESALKDHEIAILKKETEYARLMQTSLGSGLLLLLIIGGVLYRLQVNKRTLTETELEMQKQKQERLSKEVEFKNKEIMNFAVQITQRNELMEKLDEQVGEIRGKHAYDPRDLQQVADLVKVNLNLSRQREDFHSHVESVYDTFFNKLEERFPDLSESEKRLSALLRINLSSKEIASIVNISPKSVDMNRYRLRKKLGLDSEENIQQFLRQI